MKMKVVRINAAEVADETARDRTAAAAVMKDACKNFFGMGVETFKQVGTAADACLVMGLAAHLGYLDFLKNVFEMKHLGPFRRQLNPYFNTQLDYLSHLGKDIIEIKKKKAEALAENIRQCRKQAFENTVTAFDKYCDLLSTS